jgi:AhpD family alkylhydroperoxidase
MKLIPGVSFAPQIPSINMERRIYAMKFDEKTIRLIAVGASVAANCQACLLANATKAREDGADEQEIAEAIEIGKMVRAGAASKMDKYAAGLREVVAAAMDFAGAECGCTDPSNS